MQIASVSQVITTHHPQSLTSLCELWNSTREDFLPGICHQLINHQDGHLQTNIPDTGYFSPVHHHSESLDAGVVRNISIAAVLGSVLTILLVMRKRKRKTGQVKRRKG